MKYQLLVLGLLFLSAGCNNSASKPPQADSTEIKDDVQTKHSENEKKAWELLEKTKTPEEIAAIKKRMDAMTPEELAAENEKKAWELLEKTKTPEEIAAIKKRMDAMTPEEQAAETKRILERLLKKSETSRKDE